MPVVQVEDLWKKFKIPHAKKNTILENIAGALQILDRERFTYEEFWALRSINFKVEPGEFIGVIGENGSGKSTLLELLARILRPDRGRIKVDGRVASILELGVGFHPELTLKENVIIYGSIMGLKNSYMKKRMDNILEYAGLERFRDTKLKSLSSGMQVRLGFSVAIETDPDIFLIDEALAVGDIEFQHKCLDQFKEFKSNRKAVLFVSHALYHIRNVCDKTILLSKGEMVNFGKTEDVLDKYLRARKMQSKIKIGPNSQ